MLDCQDDVVHTLDHNVAECQWPEPDGCHSEDEVVSDQNGPVDHQAVAEVVFVHKVGEEMISVDKPNVEDVQIRPSFDNAPKPIAVDGCFGLCCYWHYIKVYGEYREQKEQWPCENQ